MLRTARPGRTRLPDSTRTSPQRLLARHALPRFDELPVVEAGRRTARQCAARDRVGSTGSGMGSNAGARSDTRSDLGSDTRLRPGRGPPSDWELDKGGGVTAGLVSLSGSSSVAALVQTRLVFRRSTSPDAAQFQMRLSFGAQAQVQTPARSQTQARTSALARALALCRALVRTWTRARGPCVGCRRSRP